jgi:peptidoglycan hydrolase CwlO-like protein
MKRLAIMIIAAAAMMSCAPLSTTAMAGNEDDLRQAQQRYTGATAMRYNLAMSALKKANLKADFDKLAKERESIKAQKRDLEAKFKALTEQDTHIAANQDDIIKEAVKKAKMQKDFDALSGDVKAALDEVKKLQGKQ